jgi:hypothetical protein
MESTNTKIEPEAAEKETARPDKPAKPADKEDPTTDVSLHTPFNSPGIISSVAKSVTPLARHTTRERELPKPNPPSSPPMPPLKVLLNLMRRRIFSISEPLWQQDCQIRLDRYQPPQVG